MPGDNFKGIDMDKAARDRIKSDQFFDGVDSDQVSDSSVDGDKLNFSRYDATQPTAGAQDADSGDDINLSSDQTRINRAQIAKKLIPIGLKKDTSSVNNSVDSRLEQIRARLDSYSRDHKIRKEAEKFAEPSEVDATDTFKTGNVKINNDGHYDNASHLKNFNHWSDDPQAGDKLADEPVTGEHQTNARSARKTNTDSHTTDNSDDSRTTDNSTDNGKNANTSLFGTVDREATDTVVFTSAGSDLDKNKKSASDDMRVSRSSSDNPQLVEANDQWLQLDNDDGPGGRQITDFEEITKNNEASLPRFPFFMPSMSGEEKKQQSDNLARMTNIQKEIEQLNSQINAARKDIHSISKNDDKFDSVASSINQIQESVTRTQKDNQNIYQRINDVRSQLEQVPSVDTLYQMQLQLVDMRTAFDEGAKNDEIIELRHKIDDMVAMIASHYEQAEQQRYGLENQITAVHNSIQLQGETIKAPLGAIGRRLVDIRRILKSSASLESIEALEREIQLLMDKIDNYTIPTRVEVAANEVADVLNSFKRSMPSHDFLQNFALVEKGLRQMADHLKSSGDLDQQSAQMLSYLYGTVEYMRDEFGKISRFDFANLENKLVSLNSRISTNGNFTTPNAILVNEDGSEGGEERIQAYSLLKNLSVIRKNTELLQKAIQNNVVSITDEIHTLAQEIDKQTISSGSGANSVDIDKVARIAAAEAISQYGGGATDINSFKEAAKEAVTELLNKEYGKSYNNSENNNTGNSNDENFSDKIEDNAGKMVSKSRLQTNIHAGNNAKSVKARNHNDGHIIAGASGFGAGRPDRKTDDNNVSDSGSRDGANKTDDKQLSATGSTSDDNAKANSANKFFGFDERPFFSYSNFSSRERIKSAAEKSDLKQPLPASTPKAGAAANENSNKPPSPSANQSAYNRKQSRADGGYSKKNVEQPQSLISDNNLDEAKRSRSAIVFVMLLLALSALVLYSLSSSDTSTTRSTAEINGAGQSPGATSDNSGAAGRDTGEGKAAIGTSTVNDGAKTDGSDAGQANVSDLTGNNSKSTTGDNTKSEALSSQTVDVQNNQAVGSRLDNGQTKDAAVDMGKSDAIASGVNEAIDDDTATLLNTNNAGINNTQVNSDLSANAGNKEAGELEIINDQSIFADEGEAVTIGGETLAGGNSGSATADYDALVSNLPSGVVDEKLRAEALSGSPIAAYKVAKAYENLEQPKSATRQRFWLQQAADKGMPPAQFELGVIYDKGFGVANDPARAEYYYLLAADKGNIFAMYNLAVLYTTEKLGSPNYGEAKKWFEMAANYGLTNSQYNLGILYENGLGTKRDLKQAYKWFAIAASNGDAAATSRQRALATGFSGDELKRVVDSVLKWKAKKIIDGANSVSAASLSLRPQSGAGTGADFEPSKALIMQVQRNLARLGYDIGVADGIAGPQTIGIIKRFQKLRGMVANGNITPNLVSEIDKALAN